MAETATQMRSLFDVVEPEPQQLRTKPISSAQIARTFVRWCFSLGADFRNSPDVTNLRAWTGGNGLPYKSSQERQILKNARELHSQRIATSLKKSTEPTVPTDPS